MRFFIFITIFASCMHQIYPYMGERWTGSVDKLLKGYVDIVHDTNVRIGKLNAVKLRSQRSGPFGIGFLTFLIEEKYRKIVDKYETAKMMDEKDKLYQVEIVLMLENCEGHFWALDHLIGMLHEIERKHKIPQLDPSSFEYFTETSPTTQTTTKRTWKKPASTIRRTRNPRTKIRLVDVVDFYRRLTTTKQRPTRDWWPIEYGWEIDYPEPWGKPPPGGYKSGLWRRRALGSKKK